MKKILAIIVGLLLPVMCLTGCNQQVFDFNYKFEKAYVKIGEEWKMVDVKTWTDYEDGDQFQLTLQDGTVLIVHATNLVLYNGTLPR
jgi:uncharacterized protein YxeA